MTDTSGASASQLVSTGPDDVVDQLNRAGRRRRLWPWALVATVVLALVAGPAAVVVLPVGLVAAVWLGLWELSRRTVVAFYEASGPDADWFAKLADGWDLPRGLGGSWRIQASGDLQTAHQRKVNAGASSVVRRGVLSLSSEPPPAFTTNISVPTLTCGSDALLLLPDRILVRSGTTWSGLDYRELRVRCRPSRFIEEGPVPRDGHQVDTTWRYVKANGGPDRRFTNNAQLPVMLYGNVELTTASGLSWIVDLSRVDVAEWFAAMLTARIPTGRTTPIVGGALPAPQQVRPDKRDRRTSKPSPAAASPLLAPLAVPGARGPLFHFGAIGSGTQSPAASMYAILDVETTGLSPQLGDRVVEVAVLRMRPDGTIVDEFATLVNPECASTGPEFIHHISPLMVADAPRFADIAGDLCSGCRGASSSPTTRRSRSAS